MPELRKSEGSEVILVFSGSREFLHPKEGVEESFPLFSLLGFEF